MQDSTNQKFDEVENIDVKQQNVPSKIDRSEDSIQSIVKGDQSETDEREQKVQKVRSRFSSAIRKLSRKSIRKKEKELTTTALEGAALVAQAGNTIAAPCTESNETITSSGAGETLSDRQETIEFSAITPNEAANSDNNLKRENATSKKSKVLSKSLFGLKKVKIPNENSKNSKAKIEETQNQTQLKEFDKLEGTDTFREIDTKKSTDNGNEPTFNQAEYKNKFQFTISAKKVESNGNDNNSTKTIKKQTDGGGDYLLPLALSKNRKTNVATNVTFVTSMAHNDNHDDNNNGIKRKKVNEEKTNKQQQLSPRLSQKQSFKEPERTNNTQNLKDIPSNERGPLKPSRLHATTTNNNNNSILLQTNETSPTQSHAKGAIRKYATTTKAVNQQSKTVTDNKYIGRELEKSSPSLSPKVKSKVISLTATFTTPSTTSTAVPTEGKTSIKILSKDAAKRGQQRPLRPALTVNTSYNNNNKNENKNNTENSNNLYNVTKSEEQHRLELPRVAAVKKRSTQAVPPQQQLSTKTKALKAAVKATIQNTKSTNVANSSQLLEPPDYPPPLPPQSPITATTTTTTTATKFPTPVIVPFQSPRTLAAVTTDINNYHPNEIRSTATTTTTATATNSHHTSLNTIDNNHNTATTTTTIDGTSKFNLTQEFPTDIDINSVTSVQSEAIDDNISLAESVQHNIPVQESLSPITHLTLDSPVRPQQTQEQQHLKHQQWINYNTPSGYFIKFNDFNHRNHRNSCKESDKESFQENLDIGFKRRIQYVSQPTLQDDFDSLEQLGYRNCNTYNNNNYHYQSGVSDLSLDSITDNRVALAANNVEDSGELKKLKETETKDQRKAKVKEVNVVNDWSMPAYGDLTMDQDMEPTIMTAINNEKREHLYKILVIGELGTGKTSYIKRYVHQFFSQNYRATIGVDFALKVLHWDLNTVVRLQLWDIAGQERFGNMTRVYYKEAVGAFIVFDVTRSGTFECVSKWKEDLDSKVQLPDGTPIPCILLANKCDQEKQGTVANAEKMDEYVRENGFSGWFETSAKENINIDEAARALVNKILLNDKLISSSDLNDGEKFNLNTTDNQNVQDDKSKCSC